MTEFTSEFIAEQRKIINNLEQARKKCWDTIENFPLVMSRSNPALIAYKKASMKHYPDALDHIEQQQARIEELEIKQHIQWDANMMLTMADNSKGYIDLIIELQKKLKELEKELNCYKEKRNDNV